MLIALAALLPGGAAAKRSTDASSTEVAAAPVPTPAVTKSEANAAARATKAAERAARRAERNAGSTGASEAGSETSGNAASGAGSAAKPAHGHDAAAARRAEHRAEREARKHGGASGAQPAGRAGASAKGAAPAAKTTKTEREQAREQRLERERTKERAREQRHREREGKHHETRKEREAREAEEAAEDGPALSGAGGGAQAAIAAVGVSNIAGGAPTAQAPSTAAVASSRTGRAARSRQAARARRRSGAQSAAGAATALGLATLTSGSGGATGGASHAAKGTGPDKPHAAQRESPLVKTVTKIIGVIPTALWLLIGALALAAAAFAVTTRVAARRARRLDRQRGQLLEDVGLLQAALLPVPPARLGPLTSPVLPSRFDGPGAGGDFYDVFALGGRWLAVIVGDVSGHGRELAPAHGAPALHRAGIPRGRALAAQGAADRRQRARPPACRLLRHRLAATYNPRERKLTYAAAGHPPPVVLGDDPDGDVAGMGAGGRGARAVAPVTSCSAPPIGASMRTGTRQTVVSIPGPARLASTPTASPRRASATTCSAPSASRPRSRLWRATPTRSRCSIAWPSSPTRDPTTWRPACCACTTAAACRRSRSSSSS